MAPGGQTQGLEGGWLRWHQSKTAGQGQGRVAFPLASPLLTSKCPAPEDAPRAGGEQQAQQEQAPTPGG